MKLLKTDYVFYYYGDVITAKFIDTDNKSKEVSWGLRYNGSIVDPSKGSSATDSKGVCDFTVPITADTVPRIGTVILEVSCEGVTTVRTLYIDYKAVMLAQGLDVLLKSFRNIPIYDEIGIVSDGFSRVRFVYDNWLTDPVPYFTKNGATDLTLYTDVSPDYNGLAYLGENFAAGDELTASYRFKKFTDAELSAGLQYGLNKLNLATPVTGYNFQSCPREYDTVIVMAGYAFMLRRAITDNEFWTSRLIPADSASMKDTLRSQLTDAENEVKDLLSRKPRSTIKPLSISSFKIPIPYKIDQTNMRRFTVASVSNWK